VRQLVKFKTVKLVVLPDLIEMDPHEADSLERETSAARTDVSEKTDSPEPVSAVKPPKSGL
jgi:hypothetical protein